MRRISTSIDIEAPAGHVWGILLDFPAYPEWNPFIRRIAGSSEVGSRLQVTIKPGDGSEMSFAPMVLARVPDQELRWCGRLLFRGIFDGEHRFMLTPSRVGHCSLVQEETFSGLLVPMIMSGAMLAATEAGFEAMNLAVKQRAESPDGVRSRTR